MGLMRQEFILMTKYCFDGLPTPYNSCTSTWVINKARKYYNVLICSALNVCGLSQLKWAIWGIKVKCTNKNGDHLSYIRWNCSCIWLCIYSQQYQGCISCNWHPSLQHCCHNCWKNGSKQGNSQTKPIPRCYTYGNQENCKFHYDPPIHPLDNLCTACTPSRSPIPQGHNSLSAVDVLHNTGIGFLYETNAVTSSQDLPPKYFNHQSPLKAFNIP